MKRSETFKELLTNDEKHISITMNLDRGMDDLFMPA